jgi:hypothetical protein
MAYCSGCGFNNMEAVNFCTKCGISLSKNATPAQNSYQQSTAPVLGNVAYTAELKQELNVLYYIVMGTFLISPVLMFYESVDGWYDPDFSELAVKITIFLIFIFLSLNQYLIKTKGIDQQKPGFVMGALLLYIALTLFGISEAQYSLYNWANWLDDLTAPIAIVLIFMIWQKIKQTVT